MWNEHFTHYFLHRCHSTAHAQRGVYDHEIWLEFRGCNYCAALGRFKSTDAVAHLPKNFFVKQSTKTFLQRRRRLLTGSLTMSLNAVPPSVDLAKVRAFLLRLPGVKDIHDLHVWSLSTTETALTCHLVTPEGHPGDDMLAHAAEELEVRFGIGHVTLQAEKSPSVSHVAASHNH